MRTLDRGFDAKDYYRYFLSRDEKFIIRVKKNRDIIYKNKTHNIMDVAKKYKGNYCMGFTDKHGKKIQCKISYIPVKLCAFPQKDLVLVAVYGFGKNPMLLLTNMEIQETSQKKKLCIIVTKVYLMRWRIEEYFRFKNQQFNFEDLRVMSLNPIRNLNFFLQHWQLVIWEYFILKIMEAFLWTGYLNVQKEYIKSRSLFFMQWGMLLN